MPQGYGFAVTLDSDLVHTLNVALLELKEGGQLGAIRSEWLGE
jgi:ABC-type amino acid transport substrate-binding protein